MAGSAASSALRIGVLALQGDFREHLRALTELGVLAVPVRRAEELFEIDGLIIPGGESTVMDKLSRSFGLAEPIRRAIADGLPVYGTCAGLIMLAARLVDASEGQESFGGLDVTVQRNAFGNQLDSFETVLDVDGLDGPPVRAVFIRAPKVVAVGPEVRVLSTLGDGSVVAVEQGSLLGIAFHPEMTDDLRLHAYFLQKVRAASVRS